MPAVPSQPFDLTVTAQVGRTYAPRLRELLPKARGLVKGALAEFHVILVNDADMARLHWDFMRVRGPTDVLTFPIDQDRRGRPTSGEVYVCVPHARRQAKERGVSPADEVLLYALHGMLHLSGYDDRTARDFAKMHAAEDAILTRLGDGAVFAAGSDGSRSKPSARSRDRGLPPSATKRARTPRRGKAKKTTP